MMQQGQGDPYRRFSQSEIVAELKKNLIRQHEYYLEQDNPHLKTDALCDLAGFATQYLNLVPQKEKFEFKETAQILHHNALNNGEFDPVDGGSAFRNLAKYAENLLTQPWRTDFHMIKLTSGFYIHNIGAILDNAQNLFFVMGYEQVGETTFKLLPKPNQKRLRAVSRDCYIASQECEILSLILQQVTNQEPDYPLTISEVFEYRMNNTGDADTISQTLVHHTRLRMYSIRKQQREELEFIQQQRHAHYQRSYKTPELPPVHLYDEPYQLTPHGNTKIPDQLVCSPPLEREVEELIRNLSHRKQITEPDHSSGNRYGSPEPQRNISQVELPQEKVKPSTPSYSPRSWISQFFSGSLSRFRGKNTELDVDSKSMQSQHSRPPMPS